MVLSIFNQNTRPFLGLDEQDGNEIVAIITDYLDG
jgi:phage gpG-like protein